MIPFVEALDAEISSLSAALAADIRFKRLRELERLRASLYGDIPTTSLAVATSPVVTAMDTRRTVNKPPLRRVSADRQRAIDVAYEFVRSHNAPVPTVEIFNHVTSKGIVIGGEKPANNLSAMLSNSGKFLANGRTGWTLKPTAADEDDYEPDPDIQHDVAIIAAAQDDPAEIDDTTR